LRKSDGRWGLLEKKSGARVRERASDVLVYKVSDAQAQVVDVIADAEGVNGPPRPTWIVKDLRPLAQWKEPFAAGEAEPPPPPPPDNAVEALRKDVELLRLRVVAAEDAVTQARAEALAANLRAELLARRLDNLTIDITLGRSWGHTHSATAKVRP
jgi:hypothetical protein